MTLRCALLSKRSKPKVRVLNPRVHCVIMVTAVGIFEIRDITLEAGEWSVGSFWFTICLLIRLVMHTCSFSATAAEARSTGATHYVSAAERKVQPVFFWTLSASNHAASIRCTRYRLRAKSMSDKKSSYYKDLDSKKVPVQLK